MVWVLLAVGKTPGDLLSAHSVGGTKDTTCYVGETMAGMLIFYVYALQGTGRATANVLQPTPPKDNTKVNRILEGR
jgi:hypothetical protein